MNSDDFNRLFDVFVRTVYRFEALPFYAVGGDEAARVAAFEAGEPRPERSVRTNPWLARIATSTIIDGKRWSRIRVLDNPLTDYQRYQLESYKESQAVGEEIHVVTRAQDPRDGDYWLFDGGGGAAFAVLMHYADDGSVADREYLPAGHPDLTRLHRQAQALAAEAVPLNQYLALVTDA